MAFNWSINFCQVFMLLSSDTLAEAYFELGASIACVVMILSPLYRYTTNNHFRPYKVCGIVVMLMW
jgi:hypothetical protein